MRAAGHAALAACLTLAACGPRPAPPPEPEPPAEAPAPAPEPEALSFRLTDFESLQGWAEADQSAALSALRASCARLARRDGAAAMSARVDWPGQASDWAEACAAASTPDAAEDSARFFQTYFLPVALNAGETQSGLLTGYFEPEMPVRAAPDAEFSEPILARPDDLVTADLGLFDDELQGLSIVGQVQGGRFIPYDPRAQITPERAEILAWGRPADVFFLQVQGSGRLIFPDGRLERAAFAAHNGLPYQSIGRALVARGALTLDQASKAGIERWMEQAGLAASRELMNENPRYVFFETRPIGDPSVGPVGAEGVALTAMASMAVDPAHHPYGLPVFLNVRLPQAAGDDQGVETGLLVIAQDTGGAIKGPLRGDLFFGSGESAGDLAGVMRHEARWTLLLPTELALSLADPAS